MSSKKALFGVIGVAMLLAAGCKDDDPQDNPMYFGVNQTFNSITYEQAAARWFQWAVSIEAWKSPLLDESGKYCHVDQPTDPPFDKVWFLAGTTQSDKTINRACTIPAGRALFFPVLNGGCTACNQCEDCEMRGATPSECVQEDDSDAELLKCIDGFTDWVDTMKATIDTTVLDDATLKTLRAKTKVFKVKGVADPKRRSWPCTYTDRKMTADGYWLFLPPLAPGKHTVNFEGTTKGKFNLKLNYTLTVENSPKAGDLGVRPDVSTADGPACPPGTSDAGTDATGSDATGSDATASDTATPQG